MVLVLHFSFIIWRILDTLLADSWGLYWVNLVAVESNA